MSVASVPRATQSALPGVKAMTSRKSILKRPASLPLSPVTTNQGPLMNSFSALFSPTARSAHVHFPATPVMAATYATHSSAVYDRAPIAVSPNPLELPPRGANSYSPSFVDDVLSNKGTVPIDVKTPRAETSELSADSQSSPVFSRLVRFGALPPHSPLPRSQKAKSCNLRPPRSPYPRSHFSNPASSLTPADFKLNVELKDPSSLAEAKPRRPKLVKFNLNITSLPSPSYRTPIDESPIAESEAEDESSASLSDAFWGSVLVEIPGPNNKSPMLRSISAKEVFHNAFRKASPLSPPLSPEPSLVLGRDPGLLWSPGLPRRRSVTKESIAEEEDEDVRDVSDAVRSPSARHITFGPLSTIASPSPNDPFAAFPSFSAVLLLDGVPGKGHTPSS